MAYPDALVLIQMWHSGLKCQRIGALVKINRKRLKADLALGVRKLGPDPVALKLGKIPLLGGFFDFSPLDCPDLDNFRDLADFWLSDLPVFCSTRFDPSLDSSPPPPLTLPTSSAASTLAPSTLLAVSTCDDMVVFSIDVSGAAILLKPLIN